MAKTKTGKATPSAPAEAAAFDAAALRAFLDGIGLADCAFELASTPRLPGVAFVLFPFWKPDARWPTVRDQVGKLGGRAGATNGIVWVGAAGLSDRGREADLAEAIRRGPLPVPKPLAQERPAKNGAESPAPTEALESDAPPPTPTGQRRKTRAS